ncbi:copper amine oxidase N-terminal domain-containing protein [Paenibacillus sp. KQZ6P-2]|uniref:Copper amine oxidase N-terminal domain-containing protein n=1 Tax=Paenibacillus mangrovi TaxID=2931978 RepID=A0A9X1WT39_9BACL|nr:stalk domain-containing protein [Paenibacillus mangrovi]MCJ8014201.1 copper amine oxidase N-terminal domain-containing protein [Paenibacillus mangrovi]
MKKFFTRKVLAVTSVVLLFSTVGAVAYAGSTLKKIEAYQNAGIRIEVDGKNVNLGSGANATYPIVYKGSNYVPARAVAEALGASVKWDPNRQVVSITSGTGDQNANKGNSGSTTPPSTSSSSGFSKVLDKNVDMKKAAEDNKAQALKTFKAYAKAVATQDYSDIDAIISASIVDKVQYDHYWSGPNPSKEGIHKNIAGIRSANKQDTLTAWNNAVQKATVSDVKVDNTNKLDLTAFINYSLDVKGFDAFSTIYLYMTYSVPYQETVYRLDTINF